MSLGQLAGMIACAHEQGHLAIRCPRRPVRRHGQAQSDFTQFGLCVQRLFSCKPQFFKQITLWSGIQKNNYSTCVHIWSWLKKNKKQMKVATVLNQNISSYAFSKIIRFANDLSLRLARKTQCPNTQPCRWVKLFSLRLWSKGKKKYRS